MENRDTNYTWKGQLAVGKAGEEVVIKWLRSQKKKVVDLRDHKHWQDEDIDIQVTQLDAHGLDFIGNEFWFAEVKTDTYNNQYVFFETHTAEKMPGALFKSRARVWYIYKSALGKIIEVEPARVATHVWINDRTVGNPRFKVFPVFNDKKKIRAWGVKLPISVLEQLGGMVYSIPDEFDRLLASPESQEFLSVLASEAKETLDAANSQDHSTTERGSE